MKKYFLLFVVFYCTGCNPDEDVSHDTTFDVEIVGRGIDCNLPLIEFKEASERVAQISNTSGWSVYHAYNLDESLYQTGRKLTVKVRKTNNSELFPCTTLGPAYPWITVTKATIKE